MPGYPLNFNSLGIINGIIDEAIQAEHYPEFAVNNTYGIKAYNDTVYSYAKFANNMYNGCLYQIALCRAAAEGNTTYYHADAKITEAELTPGEMQICNEAADMCRDNVESPYYYYSGRGVYDIRHTYEDPTPPSYFGDYLNLAEIQDALGVTLNYSGSNGIYYAFQNTGDFIYPNFRLDLEYLLSQDVRVSLAYGDADYICKSFDTYQSFDILTDSGNWFGGEAISLAMEYTHSDEFRAAGYAPMMVDGTEYGEVRQYGNFSFARVYEAGHEIPYYQRKYFCYLHSRSSDQIMGFANSTCSCCRVGILQPYSVPLRYRDWRGEGHCQLDILWSCERNPHAIIRADYVFHHSGLPFAYLSCDDIGVLSSTVVTAVNVALVSSALGIIKVVCMTITNERNYESTLLSMHED